MREFQGLGLKRETGKLQGLKLKHQNCLLATEALVAGELRQTVEGDRTFREARV